MFFLFIVIPEIHLFLYNQFHIDQALQLIASDEKFTQTLLLDLLPTDEGQEPVAAAANIDPIIEEAIESVTQIEGELPPECPEQRNYSTTASLWGWIIKRHTQGCPLICTKLLH